ncbi:hypothetical protein Tco_0446776 [Tanacetum coccineum]
MEGYLIKVIFTAPTITFPGTKALPLYSIIAGPFVGIAYENNKKEKRAMNIDELQRFCDATLKRILKKISAINVEARHVFKDPPLNEKDKELMVLFEEEIEERLKYRKQIRSLRYIMVEQPPRFASILYGIAYGCDDYEQIRLKL